MIGRRTTLISPEGRLSRNAYLLAFVAPFAALLGLSWVSFTGAFGYASNTVMITAAFGWTVMLNVGDALNIRRYRDIGNSGRLYRLLRPGLVLLPLLAFILQFFIPAQMASAGDLSALSFLIVQQFAPSIGPVPMLLLLITLAGAVINVLYLSLTPGQGGSGAPGKDPMTGVALPGAPAAGAVDGDDPVARALADYRERMARAPQSTQAAPRNNAQAPAGFGKKRR